MTPIEIIARIFSPSGASPAGDTAAVARREAVERAFTDDSESLFWLAEVITGDRASAHSCVLDARSLTDQRSGLFVEWVAQWSRVCTINQAILHSHKEIVRAAHNYASRHCPHGGHGVPDAVQMERLQEVPAQEVIRSLDPFARAVMLLRGVSHCTLQDCAFRLGSTRAAIEAACCELESWTRLIAAAAPSEPDRAVRLVLQ